MLGTKPAIVLSSDTAVKDLLDKRSGNYSDRPDMFIGQKMASGDLRLVVMVSSSQTERLLARKRLASSPQYRDTETSGE